MSVAVDASIVRFSRHAIERFIERVRPGLTLEDAETELEGLSTVGTLSAIPPAWCCWRGATSYLVIGDVVSR